MPTCTQNMTLGNICIWILAQGLLTTWLQAISDFSMPVSLWEGRDGLTALGHVRMGWGEWRVHAAPWPWHPNRLHYDETDTEPVRLTPERANPQVTRAWQVYPMWRQELKAPKPVQNYSRINLSQKLKKAAISSIHLLKILIQLFYLLQLKSDCLAWLNIIRKQQNEIKCIFCIYK